jgi:PncC family amidohydrolase
MVQVESIHRHFVERGMTLAAAESCTGGSFAQAITQLAGASRFFLGSAVVYSLEAKRRLLGVETTDDQVVSEGVALAMAQSAKERFGADVAVAVTGVAGPTGGTPQIPVGTVCCALCAPNVARAWRFHTVGNRSQVIQAAVNQLLEALLTV